MRQLGTDFLSDGIIGVCNDRSFAYQPGSDGASELSQPRTADILAPEPRTGEAHLRYGTVPGHEMTSVFRGDTQEEPGDGIPVTEPEGGRGLQLDGAGKGGPGMDQPR